MRDLLLTLLCCLTFLPSFAISFDEAIQAAKKTNKPVLLFFNGSDWSGTSMQMKHEIIDAPGFLSAISEKMIFVELDFPKHSELSSEEKCQNTFLKERFAVQEYPLVLLIDPQEREIVRLGYSPKEPQVFAQDLLHIVQQDQELTSLLSHKHRLSEQELVRAYILAGELQRGDVAEQIIEVALSRKPIPFFLLEKYRQLVDLGKMQESATKEIRQSLLNTVKQSREMHFSLAMIDFQQLSLSSQDPKQVIQPVQDYLEQFGKQDQKNIWRLEMMIAQYFLDRDLWQEALTHAQRALHAAPEQLKTDIAHSVEYIRQHDEHVALD